MTVPFQPAAGMLFGEFRIVRPLSAGGMGAVYVAEQTSTGKLRALKLMHPQLCADPRLRERFEQEARVGALVESDHVVQVIGAGVDQASGVPWLAMELLEGEDLAARLKRCGLFSPQDLYDIFRQLCHALGAAHRAGVVHRDLKPQNIFLAKSHSATAPWSVKVLDFGIARIAAEASTMATASLGTPLWMAPEQTEARAAITPATDVWPLGLIAFAMLTGRMYWRAANDPMGIAMPVLLREILLEPIELASMRATALGRAGCIVHPFDAWFARCVARDPSQRFPTAQDAFDALRPALFIDPRSVRPVAVMSSRPPAGPLGGAPASRGAASGAAGAPESQRARAVDAVDATARGASPTSAPASAAPAEGPRKGRWGLPLLAVALLGGAAAAAIAFYVSGGQREVPEPQGPPEREPASLAAPDPGSGEAVRPPAPAGSEEATAVDQKPAPAALPRATRPSPERGAPTSAPASASASAPASGAASAPATTAAPSAARPFDHAAAHASLQQKAAGARIHCKGKAGPKAVTARVFFNPSGAVQRVSTDPQIAATPSALCAQMLLSSARVPPFDGSELQAVSTTVAIE
ncbi:protein kinase domain-containing protein [Sorangium sp. So ce131]|uniref:serine/threonine-protein kinase n=1 Tax=Sorangium sp. So ce131 TaxID=3133282 RepID=UPI003F607179